MSRIGTKGLPYLGLVSYSNTSSYDEGRDYFFGLIDLWELCCGGLPVSLAMDLTFVCFFVSYYAGPFA